MTHAVTTDSEQQSFVLNKGNQTPMWPFPSVHSQDNKIMMICNFQLQPTLKLKFHAPFSRPCLCEVQAGGSETVIFTIARNESWNKWAAIEHKKYFLSNFYLIFISLLYLLIRINFNERLLQNRGATTSRWNCRLVNVKLFRLACCKSRSWTNLEEFNSGLWRFTSLVYKNR